MKEYISDYGMISEDQIIEMTKKYSGIVYALHTDRFYCGNVAAIVPSHLMELRIFNDDGEFKAIRFELGREFYWRYISDTDFRNKLKCERDSFLADFKNRIFDEVQYLDIDKTISDGTSYVNTGGGHYSLPVEKAERILVRSYIDYDDNGILSIDDNRIVRIMKEGEYYGNI